MGLAYTPGTVTSALTAHPQASEALLDATMNEPVREQLLIALAGVHGTAGAAAASAGLPDRARQHFTRAMDCAGAGGDLRSVSMRDGLRPLQEAAAARRDSACQDLAREVAMLRRAA
jgi:hypothetical protein